MEEITLQALLEAGCHFGHKAERWHPKAAEFIYTKKDGIHIIDLAKTKAGLDAATSFVKELVKNGGELLFVATKRQAMGVVKEAVVKAGAPYLVERWIGGFLTNWEEVKKNIDKIINLENDHAAGRWKKMPKHEQGKLLRYIERLKVFYGGVLLLTEKPAAIFVVDVRREHAAVQEAIRIGIPVVAIVDTNSDPEGINYVIPANDDAVGSIKFITDTIVSAYLEGKEARAKDAPAPKPVEAAPIVAPYVPPVEPSKPVVAQPPSKNKSEKPADQPSPAPKKRGRPKNV